MLYAIALMPQGGRPVEFTADSDEHARAIWREKVQSLVTEMTERGALFRIDREKKTAVFIEIFKLAKIPPGDPTNN